MQQITSLQYYHKSQKKWWHLHSVHNHHTVGCRLRKTTSQFNTSSMNAHLGTYHTWTSMIGNDELALASRTQSRSASKGRHKICEFNLIDLCMTPALEARPALPKRSFDRLKQFSIVISYIVLYIVDKYNQWLVAGVYPIWIAFIVCWRMVDAPNTLVLANWLTNASDIRVIE